MTQMFVSQLSFGRVYSRYLVPRLSYLQLTIYRLMVRLRYNKTIELIIYCMVYESSTEWLHTIHIMELAIKKKNLG